MSIKTCSLCRKNAVEGFVFELSCTSGESHCSDLHKLCLDNWMLRCNGMCPLHGGRVTSINNILLNQVEGSEDQLANKHCTMCVKKIDPEDLVFELSCTRGESHCSDLHKICLDNWMLRRNGMCPLHSGRVTSINGIFLNQVEGYQDQSESINPLPEGQS